MNNTVILAKIIAIGLKKKWDTNYLVGGDLTCKVLDFIELKFKNHGNIMLHMDLLDVKKKMGSKNSLDIIRTSWGSGNRDVSNKYLGLSENWVTPNHEKS